MQGQWWRVENQLSKLYVLEETLWWYFIRWYLAIDWFNCSTRNMAVRWGKSWILDIPNYNLHPVSWGRGKGLAIYYKNDLFTHIDDFKSENLQISKFQSTHCDIIALYRSQTVDNIQLRDKKKYDGLGETDP